MSMRGGNYEITERTLFLDNGYCVQMKTTASRSNHNFPIWVGLTKKAVKELDQFTRLTGLFDSQYPYFTLSAENK